jgi:tetratricopeptide (TPR) repeat protein
VQGDLSNSRLGQYEIVEPIGAGGMGSVYRAYQPSLDRFVAVKVLSAHLARDPRFSERFRREALAIARVEHINILPVYDAGQQDDCLYIAMRLVSGGTLKDRVAAGMSRADALRVCGEVAEALDFAHANGIIHRDVKPANVLLDQGDRPLLADFGIAKLASEEPGLTATGMGVGTPDYMSPEQCMGHEVGPASDQYALATMVFESLVGRLPYSGRTGMEIAFKQVNEPVPRLRDVDPAIPEELDQVLSRGLAKDPSARYPSCADFMRTLLVAAGPWLATAGLVPASRPRGAPVTYSFPGETRESAHRAVPGAPESAATLTSAARPIAAQPVGAAPAETTDAIAALAEAAPAPRLKPRIRSFPLTRPRLQIVGGLVILSIVVPAAITIRTATPPPMTGLVNFAIAEFGRVDERGETIRWENGSRAAESLSQRLEREFKSAEALTGIVQVRHQGVGLVTGATPAERETAAARMAEQMRAKMVIYGNLVQNDNQLSFGPEFYVSDLEDAAEIVGANRLGSPITSDARSETVGSALVIVDALKARSEALTYFAVGVMYLLEKQPGRAAQFFENAQKIPGWEDAEGKEVVHLFLGRAYRLRNQQDDLGRAQAAFQAAIRLNPEYARAYIGLGNVSYDWYRQTATAGAPDERYLDQAITLYERAGNARVKPDSALVETRVRVSLGNAYTVKAQRVDDVAFAQRAHDEFERVVRDYDQGLHRFEREVAQAYLGLGILMESFSQNSPLAAEYYRKAMEIGSTHRDVVQLARERLTVVEGPRI